MNLNGRAKEKGVMGSLLCRAQEEADSEPCADATQTIDVLLHQGVVYRLRGEFTKSENAYLRALAHTEEQYGHSHLRVAETLNFLVGLYNVEQNHRMAEMLARRALSVYESALGFDHEVTCAMSLCLALLCQKQAKVVEAAHFYRNSFSLKGKSTQASSVVAWGLLSLAQNCYRDEKFAEAELLLTHAALERSSTVWPEDPFIGLALTSIADSCSIQGLLTESASLYARALDILEVCLGLRHRFTFATNERYRALLARLFDREPSVAFDSKSTPVQLFFRQRKSLSLQILNELSVKRFMKGLSSQIATNQSMLRSSRRLIDRT